MNKTKTAIIGTAIASLLGGSLYIGSEINKPECDYVIVREAEEICLTEAQAEALFESMKESTGVGLGGIRFGGKAPIIKKEK